MRVLLLLVALVFVCYSKMQNVTIVGVLTCQKNVAGTSVIELWERDIIDPNDKLSEATSNSSNRIANFEITGGESEVGSIEPFLRIRHNCRAKEGCTRTSEYPIPKKFINNGVYNMSVLALDVYSHVDREKC